jgi:hypothetical protein
VRFSNDPKVELRRTFERPRSAKPRKASLLKILRTDLQTAYGPESQIGGTLATPLLVALGVSAGLELLTKYWLGKTRTTQNDVLHFLTAVGQLPKPEAEALIQFRNAIAHGYGLATRRVQDDKPFTFAVDTDSTTSEAVIAQTGPELHVVYLWPLKRFFLKAVARCRRTIAADWQRLGGFAVCIRNLREIRVSK